MADLTEALREVGRSDALAVVLAAEGPVFSAGHNFGDMRGVDLREARDVFLQCTEMMTTIQQIPQPVIAKVHALATAAGCQLVASCDLAVAADTAGFAIPGGKGGLFCHTPLVAVSRNVGRKRALEMALSGDVIDAATAADWGLINHAVPADELDEAVATLVARVTRGSAWSRTLGKRTFYAQVDLDQAQGLRPRRRDDGGRRRPRGRPGGDRRLPRQAARPVHQSPLTRRRDASVCRAGGIPTLLTARREPGTGSRSADRRAGRS